MSARSLDPYGRLPTPNQPTAQTNRLVDSWKPRHAIFELDGTGTLSGTVKEGAIPVASRKVFLLDKRNLSVLQHIGQRRLVFIRRPEQIVEIRRDRVRSYPKLQRRHRRQRHPGLRSSL
jgi:hypothetical protein